ncbi:metallothionein [Stigmatella sp. ncwal1]|uniref:Metallothionein n=1 Tax=Stigmatella ashevillensis TaxID=2995309 RepID=A0ABT5DMU5_9BACT|nr:metallothionein [Stigmatella ashevillena]MDC0714985.1 metallothionein [Stigmatella ashevillena]
MKRIGMAVAVLGLTGGVLLSPGVGHACEGGHATAPPAPSEPRPKVQPLKEVDELLTAKCQCGSKADCTCKKGECQCARCKGGRQQVMDALREQNTGLKLEDARYDASAGIFI